MFWTTVRLRSAPPTNATFMTDFKVGDLIQWGVEGNKNYEIHVVLEEPIYSFSFMKTYDFINNRYSTYNSSYIKNHFVLFASEK